MRRVLIIALLACALAGCNLLRQSAVTPFPTPDLPQARFLAPPNNATVVEGGELDIDILATDSGAGVARVELRVDDQKVQEGNPQVSASVPTFTVKMNWMAQGVGQHPLTAIAYRLDGTQSDPATILVQVLPRDSGS
jgi:hypothetical protein